MRSDERAEFRGEVPHLPFHTYVPGQVGQEIHTAPPVAPTAEGRLKCLSLKWHQVVHRIVMNTPGRNDGIMQGWFDGELVLDRRNVRFRDTNAFAINGFYFSTFLGGADADWAATKQGSRSRLLVPRRR